MRRPARALLSLLLAGSAGCSAMQSTYTGVAGAPEQDANNIAAYAIQFRRDRGQWPASYRELTTYVKGKGERLWTRRLEGFTFTPKPDGRLVILATDTGPGFADSTETYGSASPGMPAVIVITAEGELKLELAPEDMSAYD